jgi:hypothetical protein
MPTVLTSAEKQMLDFLVARLVSANTRTITITYGELAHSVDPDYNPRDRHHRRITRALYRLNHYEVENGRPMIGALVVRASDGLPGDGFASVARELKQLDSASPALEHEFWKAELARLIEYWASQPQESQLDRIEAKLDRIIKHLGA